MQPTNPSTFSLVDSRRTRVGKIAHLPRETLDLMNRRLLDGESGRSILDWLNALPEVRQVLAELFEGRPISDQNLSERRKGGYIEWFAQQEALLYTHVLASDAGEVTEKLQGSPCDHLAAVIATRLAVAICQWDGQPNKALANTIDTLAQMARTIERLRSGDHSSARLKLGQARLAIIGSRDDKKMFHQFRDWLSASGGWNFVFGPEGLTNDVRLARTQAIFSGTYADIPPDLEPLDLPPPNNSNPKP